MTDNMRLLVGMLGCVCLGFALGTYHSAHPSASPTAIDAVWGNPTPAPCGWTCTPTACPLSEAVTPAAEVSPASAATDTTAT